MLMSYSIKKILLSRTYLLSCVQATRAYFILFFFISVNVVKFMFVTGLFRLSVYRFLIFALVFHLRQTYANSSKFFFTEGFLPKVANKYFSSIGRKLSKLHLLCSVLNAVLFSSIIAFNLKGITINVRGLNKSIKRRALFRWLHKQNKDFTFLQETYSSSDTAKIWEAEWGGKVLFNHGTNHSTGVMILHVKP